MTTPPLPSKGQIAAASITQLAQAYGVDEDTMNQTVYTLAEQIHQHYCLSRGIVNHVEARPDQHVAISVLAGLAGTDWWVVKGENRIHRSSTGEAYITPVSPVDYTHFGDVTVVDAWAEPSDDTT